MLYLVATPIGNLEDFTFRAVRTLKECDYILAEDTRISRRLLQHYEISTPLKSYHKFNEAAFLARIIEDLENGKTLALISDAGTPCISDPGDRLMKKCLEKGLKVCPIPGASSVITALSVSGKASGLWQFVGFLPRKRGGLERTLKQALEYPGATVAFETCHRIQKCMALLEEIQPEASVFLAREITKKFEEFISGTAKEVAAAIKSRTLKGEIVLVIENVL